MDEGPGARRFRIALVFIFLAVAGGLTVYARHLATRSDFCDGIPREMGGCDRNLPTYEGQTCDEVAVEWGRHMNDRLITVINGPEARGGKSRSVLLHNTETVVSHLANKHMRDSGITARCDVDRFFALGEEQFSIELRDRVGLIMYQGMPETDYEEWRDRARGWIELILSDPELPYGTG